MFLKYKNNNLERGLNKNSHPFGGVWVKKQFLQTVHFKRGNKSQANKINFSYF